MRNSTITIGQTAILIMVMMFSNDIIAQYHQNITTYNYSRDIYQNGDIEGIYILEDAETEKSTQTPPKYIKIEGKKLYADQNGIFWNEPFKIIHEPYKSNYLGDYEVKEPKHISSSYSYLFSIPNDQDRIVWKQSLCIAFCGYVGVYKKITKEDLDNSKITNNQNNIVGYWSSNIDHRPVAILENEDGLFITNGRITSFKLNKVETNKYESDVIKYFHYTTSISLELDSDGTISVSEKRKRYMRGFRSDNYDNTLEYVLSRNTGKQETYNKIEWVEGHPFTSTNEGHIVSLFNWKLDKEKDKTTSLFITWDGDSDEHGFATGKGVLKYFDNGSLRCEYKGTLKYGTANGYGCWKDPVLFYPDCGEWTMGLSPGVKSTMINWEIIKQTLKN